MKCPECSSSLKKVMVAVHGARQKALSYQCPKCDYFAFEPKSSAKVISELRETPLKIRQRIVKLSSERLGMYFNRDVIRCLGLRKGDEVYVSVPDRKHILLEVKPFLKL